MSSNSSLEHESELPGYHMFTEPQLLELLETQPGSGAPHKDISKFIPTFENGAEVIYKHPEKLPGLRFVPTDDELLDHLAAKCGLAKPHKDIQRFIPSLEDEEDIICHHPENLPGAKKDGSIIHFFHKTTPAHKSGQRKRRVIQDQVAFRWKQSGSAKPLEYGVFKGWKKVMMLYKGSSGKGSKSKPQKTNWFRHQYHLGETADESTSPYVVSKIYYQQQQQEISGEDWFSPLTVRDSQSSQDDIYGQLPPITTLDPLV